MIHANNNAKILTVDDQAEDLEILNHILEKENYHTLSAKNGRDALSILDSQKDIDVILTENDDIDEKLGLNSANNLTLPFKLAFNTLLNKKLINHY